MIDELRPTIEMNDVLIVGESEVCPELAAVFDEALNRDFNFRHMFSRRPMLGMGHMWSGHLDYFADKVDEWLRSSPVSTWEPNYCAFTSDAAFDKFKNLATEATITLVLSQAASDSIKRITDGRSLSRGLHFFPSNEPSEWTEDQRRELADALELPILNLTWRWRAEWLSLGGREDFYFTSLIEEAIEGRKENRFAGLDHLIETKAVELLRQNPFSTRTAPEPWFNIYPTYFEMQKIFPRFLAICRGEESLEHVLDVIDGQIDKIAAAYSERQWYKFTIVLLSDKWDRAVFARHRATFDKCRERGIYMAGYWLDKNEIDAYEI